MMRSVSLVAVLLIAAACGDAAGPRRPPSVEPTSLQLVPGDTARLRVIDGPALVRWHSGATAIATVSSTGLVTAVSPGDTKIWAVRGADSSAVAVVVAPVICALSITMSPADAVLAVGDTVRAEARATCGHPSDFVWNSGDAAIASVQALSTSPNRSIATITAMSPGQVAIRASLAHDPGVNVSMAVVVRTP